MTSAGHVARPQINNTKYWSGTFAKMNYNIKTDERLYELQLPQDGVSCWLLRTIFEILRGKWSCLTLRLLMSYIYIYGAPSKARNANVVYIWTYVWQR